MIGLLWPMTIGQRWKDRSSKSSVKLPTVDENAEMGRIAAAEIRRDSTCSRGSSKKGCDEEANPPPEYNDQMLMKRRRRSTATSLAQLNCVVQEECKENGSAHEIEGEEASTRD